jgi:hypothetical protein
MMSTVYIEAEFVVDCIEEKFMGWSNGITWNGYACPMFEPEVADQIIAALVNSGTSAKFSKSADSIIITEAEFPDEPLEFKCQRIETHKGVISAVALGEFTWTWQQHEPQVARSRGRQSHSS